MIRVRAFARSVVDAMLDRVFTWALWRGVRDRDARVVVSYRSAQISRVLEDEADEAIRRAVREMRDDAPTRCPCGARIHHAYASSGMNLRCPMCGAPLREAATRWVS